MKKRPLVLLMLVFVSMAMSISAHAQDEYDLTLSLSRDFGYSSGTGKIQGLFSMKISSAEDLVRVVFYIDETAIGEDTEAPFRIQFSTDDYPLGLHAMYAIGYTADGRELRSRTVKAEFVSAEEGWQAALKIIGPLLVIMLVAVLVSTVVPALTGRGKAKKLPLGAERDYRWRGGTICPKCKRPYAMHLLALNFLTHRYDRCPFCGKWSLVRSHPIERLREAERAELVHSKAETQAMPEEDELRKEMDESRYQDL